MKSRRTLSIPTPYSPPIAAPSIEPIGTPAPDSGIELLGWKDNPIGGFRLWKKGDLFAFEVMDDEDTLTNDPQWDLQNWLDNMAAPETMTFFPIETVYAMARRQADNHHGAWNVCYMLDDLMPGAVAA